MKKTGVLIVIIILQTLFCSLYACESESRSNTPQFESQSSIYLLAPSVQNNHCQENSPDTENNQCVQCRVCYHLYVAFFNGEFKIQTNEFFISQIDYHFAYQQPFLSFSKKPPIQA